MNMYYIQGFIGSGTHSLATYDEESEYCRSPVDDRLLDFDRLTPDQCNEVILFTLVQSAS